MNIITHQIFRCIPICLLLICLSLGYAQAQTPTDPLIIKPPETSVLRPGETKTLVFQGAGGVAPRKFIKLGKLRQELPTWASPVRYSKPDQDTLSLTCTPPDSKSLPITFTLNLRDAAGTLAQHTFTLTAPDEQPPADFRLTVTPPTSTVVAGAAVSVTLTTAGINGFHDQINLSGSVVPSGVSVQVPAIVLPVSTTTLTLTTSPTTQAGDYTLTINGSSGKLSHATSASIKVTAAPPPVIVPVRIVESNKALPDMYSGHPDTINLTLTGGSGSYTVTLGYQNCNCSISHASPTSTLIVVNRGPTTPGPKELEIDVVDTNNAANLAKPVMSFSARHEEINKGIEVHLENGPEFIEHETVNYSITVNGNSGQSVGVTVYLLNRGGLITTIEKVSVVTGQKLEKTWVAKLPNSSGLDATQYQIEVVANGTISGRTQDFTVRPR